LLVVLCDYIRDARTYECLKTHYVYYNSVFIRRKIPAGKLPHAKPCTLKMRTARFYKMLAPMYQIIRGHIPEEPHL